MPKDLIANLETARDRVVERTPEGIYLNQHHIPKWDKATDAILAALRRVREAHKTFRAVTSDKVQRAPGVSTRMRNKAYQELLATVAELYGGTDA